MIMSTTGGKHWLRCTIEQTELPVTCLVVSPNFGTDSVVLAGTAGAGVLRSSDGGRFWELQTWGMDELDVLAIACAPVWGRREYVVASASDVLYQSPNGGRAWRKADTPYDLIVPALVFVDETTALAGTEYEGLLISHDSGRRWELLPSALDGMTINAFCQLSDGVLLAATGEGGVRDFGRFRPNMAHNPDQPNANPFTCHEWITLAGWRCRRWAAAINR